PLTENSSSSGSLEHTTPNNSSWDEQIAQEAKELRKITNIHNNEPEENRIYLTKEKNPYLEEINNTALLTNQDDKGSIHDKVEFETITNNEMNNETTIHIEENIETTTYLVNH
ncbi:24787_t:CDS:2, partial [Cetraspora pellucida]